MPIIDYGLAGDEIPSTKSLSNPKAALSTYYSELAVSTQPISRYTPSATASSVSASTTSSPSSTPSSLSETTATSSSDSLSTGAKAGIGVGAAAIVILLIAFVAFFLRRRKQRRNQDALAIPAAQPYYDYNSHQQLAPAPQPPMQRYEKDAGPARQWQSPMELDSTNESETGRQMYRSGMIASSR